VRWPRPKLRHQAFAELARRPLSSYQYSGERPIFREFGPVGTTSDCRDLETHVSGILHGKMTKPAYSQNCDEVSSLRGRITQGTEGREAAPSASS
jgi:hypothetical protein